MIRRPPRSTRVRSSAASDVYKRQYYEETKLEAHRVARRMIADGLPGVIVQPGGVYGPGDSSQVADLLEQFLDGKLPLLPFPELGICMTHVEDIAGGILLALDKGCLLYTSDAADD